MAAFSHASSRMTFPHPLTLVASLFCHTMAPVQTAPRPTRHLHMLTLTAFSHARPRCQGHLNASSSMSTSMQLTPSMHYQFPAAALPHAAAIMHSFGYCQAPTWLFSYTYDAAPSTLAIKAMQRGRKRDSMGRKEERKGEK